MSRYDHKDPGSDPDHCAGLEPEEDDLVDAPESEHDPEPDEAYERADSRDRDDYSDEEPH